MESRVERLEISMDDLKEIVARTSLQVERTSAEMAEFKEEMRQLRDYGRRENREFKRQSGDIANKYCHLIEDTVAPSVCRVMKLALGLDEDTPCFANELVKRALKGDVRQLGEFDVVAECGDYVMINETKSNLRAEDVSNLIATISIAREYFPEYRDRTIVGSVSSVNVDNSIVNFATSNDILALSVGDELMDIQNPAGFKPVVW